MAEIATNAGDSVKSGVTNTTNTVGSLATQTSQNIGNTASGFGSAIAGGVKSGAETVGTFAGQASQAMMNTAVYASDNFASFSEFADKIPGFDSISQKFTNQLMAIVDNVDIVKVEVEVNQLKEQHPDETPAEIAHRLMVKKAMFGCGAGLATSAVPGAAMALLVVDFATTSMLQAEMVYEIAGAYGFDLQDPARKAEVAAEILAVLGLAKGGGKLAAKLGQGVLRNVPLVGMVIGASSNAVILYTLGYATCRFYEAKLNSATAPQTLEAATEKSQEYLQFATTQETIMNQILVHVILAGNPDRTWETILPELEAANLSPTSLEAIAKTIDSPPPLETLLTQIDGDFAIALLAQCQKIAELDGIITPEEKAVLHQIEDTLKN